MTMVPRAGPRSTSSALMTSSLYQAEKSSLCGVTPRPSALTSTRLFQRAADQNQIHRLPNGPWLYLPRSRRLIRRGRAQESSNCATRRCAIAHATLSLRLAPAELVAPQHQASHRGAGEGAFRLLPYLPDGQLGVHDRHRRPGADPPVHLAPVSASRREADQDAAPRDVGQHGHCLAREVPGNVESVERDGNQEAAWP